MSATCTIDGCERPHEARGYCSPHYQKWYKYGDPLHAFPTIEERFWSRVDRSGEPDACWPWTGTLHAAAVPTLFDLIEIEGAA